MISYVFSQYDYPQQNPSLSKLFCFVPLSNGSARQANYYFPFPLRTLATAQNGSWGMF